MHRERVVVSISAVLIHETVYVRGSRTGDMEKHFYVVKQEKIKIFYFLQPQESNKNILAI